MKSVLFVCAGNICRSPVVEAVARNEFARAGVAIEVASAGTGPWHVGRPADPRAQASAAAAGYDLARHRARQIHSGDFARYDAVLAMDQDNLKELQLRCPADQMQRLALFLPFAGVATPQEVADPYYGSMTDFEAVVALARTGVRALLSRAGRGEWVGG